MATTTEIKPTARSKKEKLADDAKFIRDLSYEFAYGKSYEEIYEIVHEEARQNFAAEQAKIMATEKAKITAAITTMFQKTGWSAEKIADISGFPLDLVQKTVNELKG